MKKILNVIATALAACSLFTSLGVSAQTAYPDKPIRLLIPFAPGGATDLLGRALGDRLSNRMGQPVLVENKTGGGTVIASDYVAKAPADGYTLLLAASSLGTAPFLYKKVGYDPIKSFAPITLVCAVTHVLVVRPDLPINSVKELIAYAKAHPGKLSYGSVGTGTSNHLEGELFKSMAGVSMVHIPYRGSAPALTDLVGGQLEVMFDPIASTGPFIKAGKLRALAASTAKRSSSMPELPTVAQAGLPGYEATPWLGLLAPAGTPATIINRLNKEVVAILAEPEMKEKMKTWGFDIVGNTPAEFAAFIQSDTAKWGPLIKSAQITAE